MRQAGFLLIFQNSGSKNRLLMCRSTIVPCAKRSLARENLSDFPQLLMPLISQRLAQNADFWKTEFQVTDEAIEALYNLILEAGEPQSIEAVGLFFVKYALEAEERKMRSDIQQGKPYFPNHDYTVDDKVVFSHLDFAVGQVVNIRSGYNPVDGDFTILEVVFEDQNGLSADFAANLSTPHALLTADEEKSPADNDAVVQKTYGQFQHLIRPKIEEALRQNEHFVEFNQAWFLADLLVEVQEGLLNIVDAAIDINAAPLNVDTLIEQIELQGNGGITDALRFSANYRLGQDDRFENVGIEQQVLWFLNRLKPERVKRPPRRLRQQDLSFNINLLDNEQRALLAEIDDEATPAEYAKPLDPAAKSVTFVLNYHHRRLGTLPVIPALRHLLPQANEQGENLKDFPHAKRSLAPVFLWLIDGRSGDEMLCWYVTQHKYIWGLEEWFTKYKLPVGVVITIAKTDNPLRLAVDFIPQRAHIEHIKVAIAKNSQLAFEIKKRRLACRYDQLMIIGEEGSESIDTLWDRVEQEGRSIYELLVHILPELMRFTSQGAVHIKTIYSAVNVLKRCSPGLLMQELVSYDSFVSMGHGYWTYRVPN